MTTITVDEECLRNVEKLQSLLKLRGSSMSGENITRGTAVNFAVTQQLSAITAYQTAYQQPSSVSYSANCASLTAANQFSGQSGVDFTGIGNRGILPSTFGDQFLGTRKIRTRKGGDEDASSMGNR
jgi:hypothetical protein